MESIDLLVSARWIIPVNPAKDTLTDHSIAVRDGVILGLLPSSEAKAKYQATKSLDLGEQALIPGLVNAHGHAGMALFRGIADDLDLMSWLNDHMFPAEKQWVSYPFVLDGTTLAAAEMIRSGTTTFADNYYFPDAAAEAVLAAGMRAQLCFPIIDFPTNWAATPDQHLELGLAAEKQYRGHPQLKINFGPHAPYTCSDETLIKIKKLDDELGIGIQMHVHESQAEVDGELKKRGQRPIARLKQLGLLSSTFQAVHMTTLSDEDIDTIAATGVQVMHCPESNLKLASGYCPVHKLQQRGINVGLGTDGAASNNDLDMLGEMQTAALIAKTVSMEATALPAYETLAMATINGARALGWDDQIGSLEVGKRADMTAVALDDLESQPLYDPVSHLVYASTRNQVTHVWVDGKPLLNNRTLTRLDKDAIIANAKTWAGKLSKR